MTDEAKYYNKLGTEYARHDTVRHTIGEYSYTNRKTGVKVHTNTLEGYNSIFKRGMKGVYQHCKETCTATSQSSSFAIRTALRSELTTEPAPTFWQKVSLGSD